MTPYEQLKEQAKAMPDKPGIYKYLNGEGKVIYVGKAKSLKKRVINYFSKDIDNKTRAMIYMARSLEYVSVNNENEALYLENTLIKEYMPKYNILLKDDKSYPHICITHERFPKIFPTRNPKPGRGTYFGPYTGVGAMHVVLNFIEETYPMRKCNLHLSEANIAAGKFKVCLEYHLKKCKGPCVGLQSEAEYNAQVEEIKNILRGNIRAIKADLMAQIQTHAAALEFEKAAEAKTRLDMIGAFESKNHIKYTENKAFIIITILKSDAVYFANKLVVKDGAVILNQGYKIKPVLDESEEDVFFRIFADHAGQAFDEVLTNVEIHFSAESFKINTPQRGDKKYLVDLSLKNLLLYKHQRQPEPEATDRTPESVKELQQILHLQDLPRYIECFDNSNLQGTNPIASIVSFKNGRPDKKNYRAFNVKTVVGANDFDTMYESVHRRYKRLKEEEKELPQLIVIDGGKGQLSRACDALKDLELYGSIAIIGIAKRLEEIYVPGDSLPLYINKKSPALRLIQQLRDEAHRFGITAHRNKRSKSAIHTQLEELEGFGPKTVEKLLKEFKSVKNIKSADLQTLTQLIGEKRAALLTEKIK